MYHCVTVVVEMFSASLLTWLATQLHTRLHVRCTDDTPKDLGDLDIYLAHYNFLCASYIQDGRNVYLNDRIL